MKDGAAILAQESHPVSRVPHSVPWHHRFRGVYLLRSGKRDSHSETPVFPWWSGGKL